MAYDRGEYILSQDLERQEDLLLRFFGRGEDLVIFDVGACEGENSVRYGRLFPRAHVFAVEPLPANVPLLKRNIAQYDAANVTPIEACLADKEGTAGFHVSSGTPPQYLTTHVDWDFGNKSSSLLPPDMTRQVFPWLEFQDAVTVATTRLDSLAARLGVTRVDFLHLDVQGAELMVLQGAGALLERICTLWLEVEAVPLYASQPVREDVEGFLRRRGFVRLLDTVGAVAGDQFWAQSSWLRARKGWAWVGARKVRQSRAFVWIAHRVNRVCQAARGG